MAASVKCDLDVDGPSVKTYIFFTYSQCITSQNISILYHTTSSHPFLPFHAKKVQIDGARLKTTGLKNENLRIHCMLRWGKWNFPSHMATKSFIASCCFLIAFRSPSLLLCACVHVVHDWPRCVRISFSLKSFPQFPPVHKYNSAHCLALSVSLADTRTRMHSGP